jgi:VWFA-related protein
MTSNLIVLSKTALVLLTCASLAVPQEPQTTIRTQIINVVAPTVVMDKNGAFVNGLTPQDFRLYDNDKPQEIRVDVSFQPIDVVVCLQADAVTQDVLPRVRKIGPLLENLVIGEQGQVAIIAFDHRIRVMQDFTSDGEKIKEALNKINPGSTTAAQIDAVNTGVRMLSRRGKDRRRVLMLISETRDKGSEGRLKDTLLLAEVNNVLIYTVNMSRFINTLTAKAQPPRPDPSPPSARPMQGGVPQTPTTSAQLQLGNVLPAFVEIFRSTKAIFVSNPAEVFTKYTGGREFGFVSQRALEEAVSKIGEELHSQYLISYNPNNKLEGGWHAIRVEVRNRPGLDIRTRSGYWLAAVPE